MIKRFLRSVGYALQGIALGIKEERNLRIDIVAMLCVWRLIGFYSFSKEKIAFVVLITFLIPAFELMNTAVERAVHKPDDEHYMPAGAAKDAAAGGVFVMSLGSALAGAIIFWDIEVFKAIWAFYTTSPLNLIALVAFIIGSYLFITIDNKLNRYKKEK